MTEGTLLKKNSTRDLLVEALDAATQPQASSPSAEVLLDYLEGRLDSDAEAEISQLAVASPEIAKQLLALAEFAAAAPPSRTAPADFEVASGWRDFQKRLKAESASGGRTQAPRWLIAAAALLLAGNLFFAIHAWRLAAARDRPVANLASLELALRRAQDVPTVTLDGDAPLRLVISPEERCPTYALELRIGPDVGLRVNDLRRDELGRVTLLLPRPRPAAYEVALFGCAPERVLERLAFRVVRAP